MATSVTSVRDEARLVFLCAGPRENDPSIASLARRRLDWADVARVAMAARAVPVVVRRMKEALGAELPAAALPIQRLAMVEEFELRRIEERLDDTLDAFDAAGIGSVLLKGAALARTVYGSIADRPMLDLDVLVSSSDRDRAREAALSCGWIWEHDAGLDAFYRTHHHLPPLRDGRGTRTLLELHTGLFPHGHPFALDAEAIMAGASRVTRGRRSAVVPAAEDHLVYLCAHWVWSHLMNGGAWRAIRDVGAIAERGNLDWDRCVARAHAARATSCVFWTLRLARSMAGVRIPAAGMEALAPPTPAFLLDRLERHFTWQLAGERSCPSVKLGELLWTMALRPRWSAHGRSRPWSNPATAAWLKESHGALRSPARRLAESVGFATALVRV
ncbi:MAG: nucleotidyltransferase family protein [Gemmatimonadaceae bacterium]